MTDGTKNVLTVAEKEKFAANVLSTDLTKDLLFLVSLAASEPSCW